MAQKQAIPVTQIILVLLGVVLFRLWFGGYATTTIPYSQFNDMLQRGEVRDLVVKTSTVEGAYTDPAAGDTKFRTVRVDADMANKLDDAGIEYSGGVESGLVTVLLSWIFPLLLIFGFYWMMVNRIGKQGMGGLMSVGKSKARVYAETDTGVSFEDVAGVDEAKAELKEIVSFLADQGTYTRLGAHIPRGILLVGPPGTGKTLLARAVAGEAKVPFFSITGSEFVEMFVGVGAARVRDLFNQARQAAPCIIFIDELDALGRARGAAGSLTGHDEKEQTLNQLLAELDGFDPRAGIVLLAATNRPEVLDPALLRAGRFDRQVVVDRPDRIGREAILKVHMKKIQVAADAEIAKIASMTTGFTGADLANLANEAAILATRRKADAVELGDFVAAIERIILGSERRSRVLGEDERKRVAYHEMGHALVAASLPLTEAVQKVSIIPRSVGALGYTLQRPTEDRYLITLEELENRMTVLLAGRAAEEVRFGEISTGAADDLAKVTDIAREIVTRFGMCKELGQAVLEPDHSMYLDKSVRGINPREHADETAREIDIAIRELIDTAYRQAKQLLTERAGDLDAGAEMLLEHETLTPDDFPALQSTNGHADAA